MITLKSTLLYYLKCFLASEYEDNSDSFIEFSHNRKSYSPTRPAIKKTRSIDWRKIPIQKRPSDTEVLYVSALPQVFSGDLSRQSNSDHCQVDSQETACSFTKKLQAFQLEVLTNNSTFSTKIKAETRRILSTLWQSFQVESNRPGWISFRLSHHGICTWINQFQSVSQMADTNHTLVINKQLFKSFKNSSTLQPVKQKRSGYVKVQENHHIWQAQYAHARCYSLIRDWHVINKSSTSHHPLLQDTPADQGKGFNQEEALATLQSIFSSEQATATHQLIQALIETADNMFWLPERYPQKGYFLLLEQTERLCFAFDQFHRANPLVPNTFKPFPYLTLINCTRHLLALLLHDYFHVLAPEHL
ncbi:MAG: hypothetical protein AAF528_07820 [Cyanobacteria bacterium P01_C01_bin.121]